MREWLNRAVSKTVVPAKVPGVRIPLSPFILPKSVNSGEMSEWLKVHDWKSCMLKSIGGSNPPLSVRHRFTADVFVMRETF